MPGLLDDLLESRRAPRPDAPSLAEAEFARELLALTEAGLWVHPPVQESAETASLSVTHAPIGKGGTNWITKSKPGNKGQMPAYMQNVRNAIMRAGKTISEATAIAVGRVEDWAAGKGKVGPEVRAAAAKAVAEWEAMRGKSKGKVKEAEDDTDADDESRAGGVDLHLDYAKLLAVIRAQPKVIPPPPMIVNPGAWSPLLPPVAAGTTHRNDYPPDEGGNVLIAGLEEAIVHAPKGTPQGGQFISSGASGSSVQGVQARVGAKTDGKFGDQTKAKVMAFQKRKGLVVDGVVGRQTFAALAGHKNAASVKTGKLTAAQAGQLAALGKHGGPLMSRSGRSKRARKLGPATAAATKQVKLHHSSDEPEVGTLAEERILEDMLVEAQRATLPEFPERVKGLKQGEVARMPDGHAVKRAATEDGRDVFQVGAPSRFSERPGQVSYYDGGTHRTAEDALAAAHTMSAASADPESVGGKQRFRRHQTVLHKGRAATFLGVDHAGQPQVRMGGSLAPGAQRTADFGDLSVGSSSGGLIESVAEVADSYDPFS